MIINLPEGWSQSGPGFNGVSSSILVTNGFSYIDVSWIPESNPDGQYICRTIGMKPDTYLETTDPKLAMDFVTSVLRSA